MLRLQSVLAAFLAMAVLLCAHLWNQLHAERLRTADLGQQLAQLQTAQVTSARPGVGSGDPAQARSEHSDSGARVTATDAPGVTSTKEAHVGGKRSAAYLQELMKDPDYREVMIASNRAALLQFHPDLARELDLSQEQADRMLDIMARQEFESLSQAQPAGSEDDATRRSQELWQARQRRQDEEIRALIGEAKYADWKEYEDQLGVRMEVGQLALRLESTGQPLTEAQERQLVKVIYAERKRLWDEFPSSPPLSRAASVQERLAESERHLQFVEEKNRRVLEAAPAHLSQAQLGSLRKIYDQEVKIIRAEQRALRTQAEEGVTSSAADTVATPR